MTGAARDISPLRSGAIPAASRLLAVALDDDPGWTHVVPDAVSRRTALVAITRVALRDALTFSSVLAAHDGNRLVG